MDSIDDLVTMSNHYKAPKVVRWWAIDRNSPWVVHAAAAALDGDCSYRRTEPGKRMVVPFPAVNDDCHCFPHFRSCPTEWQ